MFAFSNLISLASVTKAWMLAHLCVSAGFRSIIGIITRTRWQHAVGVSPVGNAVLLNRMMELLAYNFFIFANHVKCVIFVSLATVFLELP